MSLATGPVDLANGTPFHDLDRFLELPSLSNLLLSPDGTRLITSMVTLTADGNGYQQTLCEVDPTGQRPARRVPGSTAGEQALAFLPGGDLLFLSARKDPEGHPGDGPSAVLWLLPATGGEARPLASRPAGIGQVAVSRRSGTVVLASSTMPSAVTEEDDRQARSRRKSRRVSAVLHESGPVRHWDRDLGPEELRLFGAPAPGQGRLALRDLTPRPGRALHEVSFDVSPDGAAVATTWQVTEADGSRRRTIALIDLVSGERHTLLDDPEADFLSVRYSPDGRHLAAVRETHTAPTRPPTRRLVVVEARLPGRQRVLRTWDGWGSTVAVWSADGRSLFVTADDHGRAPVFRVDLGDDGEPDRVVRLSLDDGAYTDLQPSPDGTMVYALRSAMDAMPVPVRLDAREPGYPVELFVPVPGTSLPGTLTEVTTTAADGTPLRGWVALADVATGDDPAPMVLWLHGGPHMSWSGWSWRWNPWLLTARGYAVLMPDPGLSTGYGDSFVGRGWGAWGDKPYTDVLAMTDAAEARPDIAAGRTAVMGGSFGGYLANWIAGHTDRFAGIVSHAGLWALDQFGPTSDMYTYWRRELTPARHVLDSPHHFVSAIRTPMLIVHGGRDFRVPLGESLRLWNELSTAAPAPATPHRFLYFPQENHAVLAPQHVRVWYETIFAFLDSTVRGLPWAAPEILQ